MNMKEMTELGEKLREEYADSVIIIRRGIFNYLLNEQAEEFSGKLGLKMKIEVKVSPEGKRDEIKSCGFPTSGLDKYIGKLARLGKSVVLALAADGEVAEIVEVKKVGKTGKTGKSGGKR